MHRTMLSRPNPNRMTNPVTATFTCTLPPSSTLLPIRGGRFQSLVHTCSCKHSTRGSLAK